MLVAYAGGRLAVASVAREHELDACPGPAAELEGVALLDYHVGREVADAVEQSPGEAAQLQGHPLVGREVAFHQGRVAEAYDPGVVGPGAVGVEAARGADPGMAVEKYVLLLVPLRRLVVLGDEVPAAPGDVIQQGAAFDEHVPVDVDGPGACRLDRPHLPGGPEARVQLPGHGVERQVDGVVRQVAQQGRPQGVGVKLDLGPGGLGVGHRQGVVPDVPGHPPQGIHTVAVYRQRACVERMNQPHTSHSPMVKKSLPSW